MEGYGLTETSPVIAVNRFDEKQRMIGTVGPLIDGVQVKMAEDGEILCKGPNVMMGYYKRPDLTAQEITDGWYHTGDIGMLVEGKNSADKFLKITDRKKELFKTSGGKYVGRHAIDFVVLADSSPNQRPDDRFGVSATNLPFDAWTELPHILPILSAGR